MLRSSEVNNHSAPVFHSTEDYKWYNEFKPFHSHEWQRHNFSLQYQYNIKQQAN